MVGSSYLTQRELLIVPGVERTNNLHAPSAAIYILARWILPLLFCSLSPLTHILNFSHQPSFPLPIPFPPLHLSNIRGVNSGGEWSDLLTSCGLIAEGFGANFEFEIGAAGLAWTASMFSWAADFVASSLGVINVTTVKRRKSE